MDPWAIEPELKDLLKDPNAIKKIKDNAAQSFREAIKEDNQDVSIYHFEANCRKYFALFDFPEPTKEQIRYAFRNFDTNSDETISSEQFQNMVVEVLKLIAGLEE